MNYKEEQRKYKEKQEDYIYRRKSYFNNFIKKRTTTFRGKIVKLVYSELNGDECFEKFTIGSEKYHNKKDGTKGSYDYNRLQRLEWIFSIFDNLNHCENICKSIIVTKDKSKSDRLNVYCLANGYKIVLTLVEKQDEFLIISAFYLRKNVR